MMKGGCVSNTMWLLIVDFSKYLWQRSRLKITPKTVKKCYNNKKSSRKRDTCSRLVLGHVKDWYLPYTVTPLPGHHRSYSWHWWSSPYVISNSLFVVVSSFASCSPSVACVISTPSDVVSQGFLMVCSWLNHKNFAASFFSLTLFRFRTLDHAFHSNNFTVNSCIFLSQFLSLLPHCFSVASQKQTEPPPTPREEGREVIE